MPKTLFKYFIFQKSEKISIVFIFNDTIFIEYAKWYACAVGKQDGSG